MIEEGRHPAEAWVGRVVADKYRITRCLGIGGHGAVFEAENTWTERRVALKLLLGAAALHPEISERFLREARASTRVAHPNIVEVLDMGRDPYDGTLYIVQELLQGEDLRDLLRRERTLDAHQLIDALTPVMDALTAAHALGVIHRDLKPANIFLARQHDGRVAAKLIDFGVSRVHDGDPETNELTHTGALLGTPDYMSPEQARGERTTAQSDVWALGVVLYEALCGQRPYRAANYNALLLKILAEDAPSLVSLAPGVDPALADIVHGALARDASVRWRSAAALREALTRWAASAPRLASAGDVTPSVQRAPALDLSDATPVSIEPPAMHFDAPAPIEAPRSIPVSGPRAVLVTTPLPSDLAASHPAYGGAGALPDDTDEGPVERAFTPPPVVSSGFAEVPSAPLAVAPAAPRPPAPSRAPMIAGASVLALLAALVAVVALRTSTTRAAPPEVTLAVSAPVAPSPPRPLVAAPAPTVPAPAPVTPSPPSRSAPVAPLVEARPARPVSHAPRPVPALPVEARPTSLEIRAVFTALTPAVRGCVGARAVTVLVAITALSTGRVSTVQISAPFAGTPAGSCIAAVVRRARLRPFRDPSFTFSWPYVIPAAEGQL